MNFESESISMLFVSDFCIFISMIFVVQGGVIKFYTTYTPVFSL